jgi:phosphoglycolate phosphatase
MSVLCLFDCDGTLVDSAHTIVAAMTRAFADCGLAAPDAEAVRGVIGLPLRGAIAALLVNGEEWRLEPLAVAYKSAFADLARHRSHAEPLYPGVEAALSALAERGWLLGVATGKSRRGALATLGSHGLLDRFVTVQTADDGSGKPAPDMVLNAMRETGVDRRRTVMIGDSIYDMAMARNADVRALGVSWGYNGVQQLRGAGAELIVHGFDEVVVALDEWFRADRR